MKNLRQLIAIAALALGIVSSASAQTAVDTAATAVTDSSLVITPVELQVDLPTGDVGMIAFVSQDKIDIDAVVGHLASRGIKARPATEQEDALVMQKFGKDQIYSAALKYKAGEGDPSSSFRMNRAVVTLVSAGKVKTAEAAKPGNPSSAGAASAGSN